MFGASTTARTRLDAAQTVIDLHRSAEGCFGRCAECAAPWPCESWRRAGKSFTDARQLPHRTPVSAAHQIAWSPVDWFGSGNTTVVGAAPNTPPVLHWRTHTR